MKLNFMALMLIVPLTVFVKSIQWQPTLRPMRREATPSATVAGTGTAVKGDLYGEIAFSSDRGGGLAIFVMDLQKKTIQRLTNTDNNFGPAWSPDGKKIVFSSDRSGRPQIYVINADGTS